METWISFVIIAQGIWAFTSLIDKFVISKSYIKNPLVYIVLNGFTNVLLIFLLPFVDFEPLNLINFLIALLSSTAVTIGIILYYKAVQYEEISRITILNQLIPVFVLVLSFLILNESLPSSNFIGFIFLLSAGLVVSYKKIGTRLKISRAFYLMFISAIFIAVAYVSAKHIFNVTTFWSAVLWLRLTSFVALVVLFAPSVRKEFIETFTGMKNSIKGLLGLKMTVDFIAFIISDFAILLGPVSLVSALSASSSPLLVFVLALLTTLYFPKILKEDISRKNILIKLLAILLIIIDIIFVNL